MGVPENLEFDSPSLTAATNANSRLEVGDLDLLKALYSTNRVVPVRSLMDLADAVQDQMIRLAEDPAPERFIEVAANLEGAKRAVIRIAAELSERGGDS